MLPLTVLPGVANSAALTDMPEPPAADGPVLVRSLALGVCGTDTEIVSGGYGAAPPGENRLIIGHESLGRVEEAPGGSGFSVGDLVVGIVRRPDPAPCAACANGEWDMCLNGRYTERGIKARHGFGAERFRSEPQFLVKLDRSLDRLGVLLEPTTMVAKAWEQIARIGARATWRPRRVPVTGAGPIGLLAALIGAQKGFELHVLDRHAEGARPELVEALGGTYHTGAIAAVGLASGSRTTTSCRAASTRRGISSSGSSRFATMSASSPRSMIPRPSASSPISRKPSRMWRSSTRRIT